MNDYKNNVKKKITIGKKSFGNRGIFLCMPNFRNVVRNTMNAVLGWLTKKALWTNYLLNDVIKITLIIIPENTLVGPI